MGLDIVSHYICALLQRGNTKGCSVFHSSSKIQCKENGSRDSKSVRPFQLHFPIQLFSVESSSGEN